MKTKHEFILALVAISMLVLAIQSNAASAADPATQPTVDSAASTQPAVSLKISGTIKNFDEFVALVEPETYIQLVPLSADGKIGITTDSQGRFAYNSDLLKLSVPKKAMFSFNVPNTPPGKYFLAAQRLQSQGMTARGSMPGYHPNFLTDKNKLFIIDVPVDAKSPFTINAGDLIVWTH